MRTRPLLSKHDWLLCLGILLFAGLFWLFGRQSGRPQTAQLYSDGALIQTISLEGNQVFCPEGFPQVQLQVQDHRIRFLTSDCPDQTCVQTGFLSGPGQYAVCLPYRLMLQIPSADQSPDAVTAEVCP